MKKRFYAVLLIGALTVSLLSGCKKKAEEVPTEVTESEEIEIETETQVDTSHLGQVQSFYNGQWIAEEDARKRPIAIMVENTTAALPQYGLNSADMVYECPVEGGISRLMAIFQNYEELEKIGNVRSCRGYYCYFAGENGCVYIHAGESSYAKKGVLASGYIEAIDGITDKGGQFFFRDDSRKAPHNYYITGENINAAMTEYEYSDKLADDFEGHLTFATEEEPNEMSDGQDAAAISLYFQNAKPYYVYNSEDGLYYRSEFGKEQVDGTDSSQLTTKNIVVQFVDSEVLDKYGRLKLTFAGTGTGYYLSNGKYIEITWTREEKEGQTHYFDSTGAEIKLNPGRTWFEICETSYQENNKIYPTVEEFENR